MAYKVNRLKLDFSLQTNAERNEFLEKYLQSPIFEKAPPTEDELSTMADYILWGKDPVTGKNAKQEGIALSTKHGTWDDSPIESLEQLLEQPTFNEASLSTWNTTQFRKKKEKFSREEALAQAPEALKPDLLRLFYDIDLLDYGIEQYELTHGRRQKAIRQELINRLSQEERDKQDEKITHWNQYKYLKKRHLLVELRREQYTLRDSFIKVPYTPETDDYAPAPEIDFGVGIEVLPLGVNQKNSELASLIFRTWRGLDPDVYSEKDLALISDCYWQKKAFAPNTNQLWVDFREEEHVYQLLNFCEELDDTAKVAEVDSNLRGLLDTLEFYISVAELTDIQREILELKLAKQKNCDIASTVNTKYGKTYTQNYISTIFRQKIIPKINEAAKMHELIIENIFFPENFKRCTGCGENKLRCPENYTRRTRANDGYSTRCKVCEKQARTSKKD